jgi:hypothetical protein
MKTVVRVGVTSIAGVVAFFAANRILRNFEEAQQHKFIIGGIIAGFGVLTWLAGRARRALAARDNPTGSDVPEGVPLFSLQFWGPVAAICGGLLVGQDRFHGVMAQFTSKIKGIRTRTAEARESSKSQSNKKKSSPESSLKLQGIFYRKSGSSALIDGQTVYVGDWIGAAQITSIDKKAVTIEVGGASRTLHLK